MQEAKEKGYEIILVKLAELEMCKCFQSTSTDMPIKKDSVKGLYNEDINPVTVGDLIKRLQKLPLNQ